MKAYVLVYLDDVTILAKDINEAIPRLRLVLELASEYDLISTKRNVNF